MEAGLEGGGRCAHTHTHRSLGCCVVLWSSHKKAKLDGQGPAASTALFAGVKAYVNGYTRPSLNELRAIVGAHGGRIVQYWSRKSDLTHVIAENLPANKIQEVKDSRNPVPVVLPTWIVEW